MDIVGGNGGRVARESRARDPAARWRRLVRDHEASGSGVREFCRDRRGFRGQSHTIVDFLPRSTRIPACRDSHASSSRDFLTT